MNEPDELLRAFEILDTEGKGFFQIDEIRRYFTQYGEPFGQDEIEELLNASVNNETKTISYKTFLHYLTIDEEMRL